MTAAEQAELVAAQAARKAARADAAAADAVVVRTGLPHYRLGWVSVRVGESCRYSLHVSSCSGRCDDENGSVPLRLAVVPVRMIAAASLAPCIADAS